MSLVTTVGCAKLAVLLLRKPIRLQVLDNCLHLYPSGIGYRLPMPRVQIFMMDYVRPSEGHTAADGAHNQEPLKCHQNPLSV